MAASISFHTTTSGKSSGASVTFLQRWAMRRNIAIDGLPAQTGITMLAPSREDRSVDGSECARWVTKYSLGRAVLVQRGGSQMIVIDRKTGFLVGGSDPRKDGLALGW